MQNKPNFLESQTNVSPVITEDYEKKTLGELGQNKPNTNPIKPNTNPISTPKTSFHPQNKPNTKPKKCCGVCRENFCERKQAKRGIDVNEQV